MSPRFLYVASMLWNAYHDDERHQASHPDYETIFPQTPWKHSHTLSYIESPRNKVHFFARVSVLDAKVVELKYAIDRPVAQINAYGMAEHCTQHCERLPQMSSESVVMGPAVSPYTFFVALDEGVRRPHLNKGHVTPLRSNEGP